VYRTRDDIAATGIDVSGAVSPIPLMRERSIATPIAKLLSQATSRNQELTSLEMLPCSSTEAGPVGTIDWKVKRIFG